MKKKILLLAIQYPFTLASYFIKALQNREDVELLIAGPDHGTWIPWMGGMTLAEKYAPHVDIPLQKHLKQFPCKVDPDELLPLLPWTPDLIINIDAGCFLTRKPGVPYAVVATDSHCLDYRLQRMLADRFYNMHKRYSVPSDIWLPYAYSPDYHYHEEMPIKYDVCLIGMAYPHRNELERQLTAADISSYFNNGEVFDEYRRAYCSARIGLNWASMDDLNARHFELLAMGIPSVQFHTTDADELFDDGIDYVSFRSASEAVSKVRSLLDDPEKAARLVENGYRAVKPHTYDARIEQILGDFFK